MSSGMKIRKGDNILVISGKDKGKTGKVVKTLPEVRKVVVEGVNIRKKHTRPKKEGQKGQIVQMAMPIDVSDVKIICPKCSKAVRVSSQRLENNKKMRVCKKCGGEL